ncbi:hypothetical protein CDAR_91901 [Caerostris darwini]|uniref:Uncharacterized protein n=1 Tax=Caerostris darwini TaxID=1538125 RepID=A0AAV4QR64_9ARAC|nr:hypothetical protein CDAR_91901 [Caerostris darwini]
MFTLYLTRSHELRDTATRNRLIREKRSPDQIKTVHEAHTDFVIDLGLGSEKGGGGFKDLSGPNFSISLSTFDQTDAHHDKHMGLPCTVLFDVENSISPDILI